MEECKTAALVESELRVERPRYAVITPVRDEGAHLPRLALCMISQSVKPLQWVLVDTGSTDSTLAIADTLASLKPWIVVKRLSIPGPPTRGGPVVDALHEGLVELPSNVEFVLKIDADVSFDRDHVEQLLAHFRRAPELGIASGERKELQRGRWRAAHPTATTVEAQLRAYRMSCLRDVLPFHQCMGWDVLDESRAVSRGWATLQVPELGFFHHRSMGARDKSRWAAWNAQGEIAHFAGYRPSYLFARALYRTLCDPPALLMAAAYLRAKFRRIPVATDQAAIDVRRSQQRLRHLPTRTAEALGLRKLRNRTRTRLSRAQLLLVCSQGGHLLELVSLERSFRQYSRVWVTEESPDAHELLRGEVAVFARGDAARNARLALRNLFLALRILIAVRPHIVMTNGAAIAVPFVWVARLCRSRVVFIECAGRADGKSLARKLSAGLADRVFTQWPEQTLGEAQFAGYGALAQAAVLRARLDRGRLLEELQLLVTVGTSRYSFDRLLRSVEPTAEGASLALAQCGANSYHPAGWWCVDFMDPAVLFAVMESARVVVCHAGIGAVSLAVAAGHTPIVVPRRAMLGEAVDDHQLTFARRVDALGLAILVVNEAELATKIRTLDQGTRTRPAPAQPDLVPELQRLFSAWLGPGMSPSGRSSVSSLLSTGRRHERRRPRANDDAKR